LAESSLARREDERVGNHIYFSGEPWNETGSAAMARNSYLGMGEGNQRNSTMGAINSPTRIGGVLVMPGDVILGRDVGVMFVPPQLAARVVMDSMRTRLEDTFSHQRLAEKKYTAGQIDGTWAPEIQADHTEWLKDNIDKLSPYGHADVQQILDERARPRPPRPAPPDAGNSAQ
jgi:hypothetical protein